MKKILVLALLLLASATEAHALYNPQGDGRKVVTTAGTAVALSATDTAFTNLDVCAETDNTGIITVGTDPVASLSTREGVPLSAGDCYSISHKGVLTEQKIDSTVNGDGVTYAYWYN